MKVLHIIDSGGLYGAEMMLLNLVAEQRNLGLDPIIASIGEPQIEDKAIESEATKRGFKVVKFRMRPGPNLIGVLEILRFTRSEGVALLHSHGYKGNILFGLMPKVIRKLPMVTTIHGWTWTGGVSRMMVYEWLDSLSLRFVSCVVVVNAVIKQHQRLKNLPESNIVVIKNSISFNSVVNANNRAPLPPEIIQFIKRRFTVVGIGRFSNEKNFGSLIQVVSDLVGDGLDLQLLLLGQGDLEQELRQRVEDCGLVDRVLMPGYVSNVVSCLQKCQLFAMPSLTEGLPIALLEAMVAEIPIVASRVGGIPDALDDGKAGLLIEPNKVEELREAIGSVYTNMDVARQRVGYAKERVRAEFSSRKMAAEYLETYKKVLSNLK